jgi:hypothetical protein
MIREWTPVTIPLKVLSVRVLLSFRNVHGKNNLSEYKALKGIRSVGS